MANRPNSSAELRAFTKTFDTAYEDKAAFTRGQFLKLFSRSQLKNMTLAKYAIGRGTPSFCTQVEVTTKAWASMQGANAFKFGIYFGKTNSEPEKKYRFTKQFGRNEVEAFDAVKAALIQLVRAGKLLRFEEIDRNPLSQTFKAKILSLYFPKLYLNVCSAKHIERFAAELGIQEQPFISRYQHLLMKSKAQNAITRKWSNPKFMSFLYSKYDDEDPTTRSPDKLKKPRRKSRRKVDFEEIERERKAIGKKSEKFAMAWERSRLVGLGYRELAAKIDDRRDRPSYGYDFLSFSSPGNERYVEVKSVGRDYKDDDFRFYLSENELLVSRSKEHRRSYYFYLVFYKDKEPCDLKAVIAAEIYSTSKLSPCVYKVRFDREGPQGSS